jgi:hypothetical protein
MAKGRVALSGRTDELGDIADKILPAVHGETLPSPNGAR